VLPASVPDTSRPTDFAAAALTSPVVFGGAVGAPLQACAAADAAASKIRKGRLRSVMIVSVVTRGQCFGGVARRSIRPANL
jgi:hypothetical protein